MLKVQYDRHLFLSYDPVITAYMGSFNGHKDSITPDLPGDIKADVIFEHVSWNVSAVAIKTIKSRYKKWEGVAERMLIVNSSDEATLLEQIGVPGFQCSHDIYLPDYDFTLLDSPVLYDAIYTARLAPFKRHYLVRKLRNARMLTGGTGANNTIDQDMEQVDPSNQIYLDYLQNKSVCFDKLDTAGVCAEINKSHSCLALSAEEGQMSASSEYLLCGKPVVSTRSRGGRDIFYNKDNSTIIEDNEDAVVKAVQYWVANPPDGQLIRRNYLNQLNTLRYDYSRRISQLQMELGGRPERPERIFYDLFVDKSSYLRRLLGAGSTVSKAELSRILSYPETEIIFRPSPYIVVQKENDGYIIDGHDMSVRLDELSSWIFSQLDGQTTINTIVSELVNVYGDSDQISTDVRDTIEKFIKLGVIEIASYPA